MTIGDGDAGRIQKAKAFLKTLDDQGDLFALVTDDIEIVFPKWGTVRGKEQLGHFFHDLGGYISSIAHDPATYICMSGEDHVAIEGVSSGSLVNGSRWPEGESTGRFCSVFKFDGDLISHVRIHLDPDYTDATASHYAWRRERATTEA